MVCGLSIPVTPGVAVDYLADIKPVLKERCYACHGALKQEAGLRVDTAATLLESGVVGSGELLRRLTSDDPEVRMPREAEAVEDEFIESVRVWIAAGAPRPEDEAPEEDPSAHWAFQRVERPAWPEGVAEGTNVVDAYLGAAQREAGVSAVGETERGLLLRRLNVDLLGYVPSAEEMAGEDGYEEVVERLLADPAYGERWGRHFMDIWRYSDWYGLNQQLRNSQKHLWRWRDWIVESLNADKGYDRMVVEMLAGDELAPGAPEVVRATGFLARNYYLFNRTTWLDDTIEHTTKALLGLTMDCAKSHDHKYDPVSQRDYYAMRAIFEPHQVRLDAVPGEGDFDKDGLPRVYDERPDEPTYLHVRGDPKEVDESEVIGPGVPAVLGTLGDVVPVSLPASAYAPGTRGYVREEAMRRADEAVAAAGAALERGKRLAGEQGEQSEVEGEVLMGDGFEAFDVAKWETLGDGWAIGDGVLTQSVPDRGRENVRMAERHPVDFEVNCRFTITGGTTFKSVGVHFDVSDDGGERTMVYLSAHGPGPKLQVAHERGGKNSYPEAGRLAMPVEVGRAYDVGIRVRGRLLNVSLDGEPALAYALPERPGGGGGRLELSAFDATAAFDSIELRSLPEAAELVPAGKVERTEPVAVLEAKLAAAEAERAALEGRIAADHARQGGGEVFKESAERARGLELAAAVAAARVAMAEAEAGRDEKKRKSAAGALAKAEEAAAKGGGAYAPLRGSKKALEGPDHKDGDDPRVYSPTSSGRRLAFARWVTSRDNPLTARVAVNHVWARHFGEPLVEAVFDFGRRSDRPAHAALLDALAVELIESGWSLKHLHRVMVTSAAYRRMSSSLEADAATLEVDEGNGLYWRMNPRRMESQVVRDSLLRLAGVLDGTRGGPPVDVGDGSRRRSLYFKHSRDDKDRFLSMFDDANFLACYRRSESIVPQQALALANGKLALESAGLIAGRLAGRDGAGAFVAGAFELVLGRAPDAEELAECCAFLGRAGSDERARELLVHALLNHNDFVTVR